MNKEQTTGMNRRILSLALPNILTNITVPLLGMADMAIVGHLSPIHIGAIAIGTSIFNLIYWNFGFLRMGTSGFTAQAYGAHRMDEAVRILMRGCGVAVGVALLLLALQVPIALAVPYLFEGSQEVIGLALKYFFIRIWAAPATLGLYAIKGWFIGMQNPRIPMWIAIGLNCVNIGASLFFVMGLGWDIEGVALGTVIAQYSGLVAGVLLLRRELRRLGQKLPSLRSGVFAWKEMRRFFSVNGDIFLRTVCLSAVFTFITAASTRMGDSLLAVDALLLQFFTLFSYVMDGFAYAGESLVGRYIGAHDAKSLRLSVRLLLLWGGVLTVAATAIYALWGKDFLYLFSDEPSVISEAGEYMGWVLAVPVCGFAAFLFDGVFVGATASHTMRNAMFVATAVFFGLYFGLKTTLPDPSAANFLRRWNNSLWTAFMAYLLLRGLLQGLRLKKDVYSQAA